MTFALKPWIAAAIASGLWAGAAAAEDRTLTLTNSAAKSMTGFYVTPAQGEASAVNMVASPEARTSAA